MTFLIKDISLNPRFSGSAALVVRSSVCNLFVTCTPAQAMPQACAATGKYVGGEYELAPHLVYAVQVAVVLATVSGFASTAVKSIVTAIRPHVLPLCLLRGIYAGGSHG